MEENTGVDDKRSLTVPYALIVPIWGIVASVVGLFWKMDHAQTQQHDDIKYTQQSVDSLSKRVDGMDRKLSIYSDSSYTVADAQQQQKELDDHETRIRALEKRKR